MDPSNLRSDRAVLEELGARLAHERVRRNWTQAQLAHEAGISKRTLERLEAGHSVQLGGFVRVLRALGALGGLDALLPPAGPTPMEQLRGKGKVRRRASPTRGAHEPSDDGWRWGEDA